MAMPCGRRCERLLRLSQGRPAGGMALVCHGVGGGLGMLRGGGSSVSRAAQGQLCIVAGLVVEAGPPDLVVFSGGWASVVYWCFAIQAAHVEGFSENVPGACAPE